jgi:hypothetical protein
MLFGKGGTLCIPEGATMHYGDHGRGLMALKTGGRIIIERNAELVMHGTMVMYEYAGETVPADIHMTLPQGARLSFAPGSHIWNMWSIDQDMKLHVYLDGGAIDLSGLPEAERAAIVVVTLPAETLSAITIIGDAGNGSVDLLVSSRVNGSASLTVIDAAGRTAVRLFTSLTRGPNVLPLNTASLGPGSYFIVVEQGEARSAGRFVRM